MEKKQHYSEETKIQARNLWLSGIKVSTIAKDLGINSVNIIYKWRDKFAWASLKPPEPAKVTTARQYNYLLEKPKKTESDLAELDKLAELLLKFENAESRTGKRR